MKLQELEEALRVLQNERMKQQRTQGIGLKVRDSTF
jgi:hypothetical protein